MFFTLEIKGYNARILATGIRGKPYLEKEQRSQLCAFEKVARLRPLVTMDLEK